MTDSTETPQDEFLDSPAKFHLEMPLYRVVNIDDEESSRRIHSLMSYSGTIDAYCIWCEKESVFDAREYYSSGFDVWRYGTSDFKKVTYRCMRSDGHGYYTFYLKAKNSVTKVGQFPSVADFQIPQAKKYRKVLGNEQYKELTRGIGLAANGVGIGSFVYLRRIFGNLIEQAHEEATKLAKKNGNLFPEKEYFDSKMNSRISLLKDLLPETLVENRELYGILSTGIHELSEEECLTYFVPIRIGIEQILDEKIDRFEKAEKAKAAREAIKGVSQKIAGLKKNEDSRQ